MEYKEHNTGIIFPEMLDGHRLGKITQYEIEPGKPGVSIQYQSGDAETTIFIRAMGSDAGKTSADFLTQSFDGIKTLEAQGKYSNVKIYDSPLEKERPGWRSGAFTSSSTNRFLVSFILCKITANHLVKIRATTGISKVDHLKNFTQSLQLIVDGTPTSVCS